MLIKKIITAGILFVILATSVAPVGVRAQPVGNIGPQNPQGNVSSSTGPVAAISGVAEAAMYNFVTEKIAGFIGWTLQRISGLFLLLSGLLFDTVVRETVVEMSQNLSSKNGIGLSINQAWTTLRDIANMVFIFVLLYTAFNAMFTSSVGNVGRNIAWIIIIALVINFSLFFSKVVIDASNVVSLGFYKAIANTGSYDLTIENKTASGVSTSTQNFNGISAGYMRMLGIHSFWSGDTNTKNIYGGQNVLIMGILTAVFVLVAAVILFITSIMFVSRFVILIFIMILSPVAFVMYIIPGMSDKFTEWRKALINQAFFAPVFFALTWVVFKVGSTMSALSNSTQNGVNWTQIVSAPSAMMGLVINYFIIIGLSIFALTAAKKMASSVAGFTAITGGIGAGVIGGAAFIGRQTFGRRADRIANDKDLQERVAAGTATAGERAKLATAQKFASSTFDFRGIADTKVGKFTKMDQAMDILGKSSGVGGFKASEESRTEKRRKPIDLTMRQFRDKPSVIAGYLMRQSPQDQQYMYDKLGARDRAAINDELDKIPGGTAVKDRLMNNMSIEEKEKTTKAGKDAAKDARSKQFLDEIENLVAGRPAAIPGTRSPATPGGTPASYDDLLTGRNALRVTDARKLSIVALNDAAIIARLSPRHLADIITNKDDIDDATVAYIVSVIQSPPPYPLQTAQANYINGAKAIWGIP